MSELNKTPEERHEIVSTSEADFWTEKWGITEPQLREAIQRTDSQDVDTIEGYLINHKYI